MARHLLWGEIDVVEEGRRRSIRKTAHRSAMLRYADRLRAGEEVSDDEFDQVYSEEVKSISFRHWSPVAVAKRAARLLEQMGATRVLDIGAGSGKFCVVGALATSGRFTGIEQRRSLVDVARMAAVRFGAERTHFVHTNMVDFDWEPFDGFYFYNPFQEQVEDGLYPIDQTITRSPDLHKAYLASATAKLIRAPVGTAVVTYCGFGGVMPSEYRCVHREEFHEASLILWVRAGYSKMVPQRVPADSAEGLPRANEAA